MHVIDNTTVITTPATSAATIPDATVRPGTVTASFVMWLVTVILGIAGGAVMMALSGLAAVAGATPIPGTGIGAGVYLTAAALGLTVSLAQLLFVFKMRAGHNWARITLTVLASVQLLTAITGTSPTSWVSILAITATALLYVPTARTYFHTTRRTRSN